MPAKSQWLLRVPSILERLRTFELAVVDRVMCERLFGVHRRRAVELMHYFGGYQSGNIFLLDRLDLIQRLETLQSGSEFQREEQRKVRLAEKLDRLHRYRAAAAVRISVLARAQTRLPAGVSFSGRQMVVAFTTVEELLSRLYALSQAAAEDFAAFKGTVERSLAVAQASARMLDQAEGNLQKDARGVP